MQNSWDSKMLKNLYWKYSSKFDSVKWLGWNYHKRLIIYYSYLFLSFKITSMNSLINALGKSSRTWKWFLLLFKNSSISVWKRHYITSHTYSKRVSEKLFLVDFFLRKVHEHSSSSIERLIAHASMFKLLLKPQVTLMKSL